MSKYFKDKITFEEDVGEDMFIQLAKNMAKEIDIDFCKTPLIDLLTGYKDYIILQNRIDNAIEYIKNKPLYTETYDYNEEDNLELKYIDDEIAKNDLLAILGEKRK